MLGKLVYLIQVGLVSVSAKFQLSSLSKSCLKVPGGGVVEWGGGWVVVGWLRPILVINLSLCQAEQNQLFFSNGGYLPPSHLDNVFKYILVFWRLPLRDFHQIHWI